MKNLVLSFIFIVSTFFGNAQNSNPVFNWVVKEISPGNNLKGMSISSSTHANLLGYGRTFKTTSDGGASWQNVNIAHGTYNFIDFSIKGNVGYIVSTKTKAIDNPDDGEDDVYATGIILKTTDRGQTWTNLDLSNLGTGDDRSANPSAQGCMKVDFMAVECVNDNIALVGLRWEDYTKVKIL